MHPARPSFNSSQNMDFGLVSLIPEAVRSKRRHVTARLLGSRVQIPLEAWMSLSCECCVLSGSKLSEGLISRPEESYRLWWVTVCYQAQKKTLYTYNK